MTRPSRFHTTEASPQSATGRSRGLIKNLQDTYYTVRAFYKDRDDRYYYSQTMSFDPTDFSFFEPTVHTYPAEAEGTQATLRGYVLGGTDNISGQGFQYWAVKADTEFLEKETGAYEPVR